MKALILQILVLSFLAGCSTAQKWTHDKLSYDDYIADMSACEALVNNSLPNRESPQYRESQIVSPNAYSAMCTRAGNTVKCSAKADQSSQIQADIRTQSENAGRQMGYGIGLLADAVAKQNIFNKCMHDKGYYTLDEEQVKLRNEDSQEKNKLWRAGMDEYIQQIKSLCSDLAYEGYYKNTTCKSGDLGLDMLSNKRKASEEEKKSILAFYEVMNKITLKRIEISQLYLSPFSLKEDVVRHYTRFMMAGRENLLQLYSGEKTWGEFNRARLDQFNDAQSEWKEIFSRKR